MDISETAWWNDLCHGIFGPRKGGARIIIDAESAATGVGKTTLAVALARALSTAFGYDLVEDDLTLSGEQYLERWREHPGPDQPSVIVLDELAGAGAGDARRSMSTKNVNLVRSWQLMRKKRICTITTLPHWSDADKRMRRFADYRLYCLERPIGYFRPYRVSTSFSDGHIMTHSYDDIVRIKYPNLGAHGDELLEYVTSLKDDLLASEVFDADDIRELEEQQTPDEAEREQKIQDATRARQQGLSTREAAAVVDMSQSWIQKYTNAPDEETTS
jgi:hypothetical protein